MLTLPTRQRMSGPVYGKSQHLLLTLGFRHLKRHDYELKKKNGESAQGEEPVRRDAKQNKHNEIL